MTRKESLSLKAVAFASAAIGVVLASTVVHAEKSNDTLNAAFSAEIATLDYYMGSGRNNLIMSHHIYDTLLYKDQSTGEIIPALATNYKYLDDTTIEFTLREGVRFHDGSVFDADDVVYTLNKAADPDYGAVYQISVGWIDRAEKLDAYKVRLYMKQPYPVALEWLAGFLPIYPSDYYEKVGKEGMSLKPIGTGPYKLVSVDPGTRWKLTRFDQHYSDSPKGSAIKNIDIRILPEMNTQMTELMTGKLDFIWKFPPDQAQRLKERAGVEVKNTSILRVVYIQYNAVDDSPLTDVRVRKALIHAINRQHIMDAFVGGASIVVHTPCNPVQFGCYTEVAKYDYDPAKAKQLLAEAGYADGFETKILVSQSPSSSRPVAEAILGDLAKVGITADIEMQQYAAAREKWISGGIPMILMSWGSWGIGDVALFTSEFFGGGDVDKIRDEEIVQWIRAGDTSTSREERRTKYANVMKKVANNALWLPLWTYNVNYATTPDLDFTLDPDEIARLFNAKWK